MKSLFSSKTGRAWGVIESQKLATLLVDADAFHYFLPFMLNTCTASQAARQAKARIDTMLYRIERFLAVGLLVEVPGVTPRSRKRYRSVAERFVVPFEATQAETLVELLMSRERPQQRQLAQALVTAIAGEGTGWMLRIHCDDSLERPSVTVDAAPQDQLDWDMAEMLAPSAPATWYTTQTLNLDESAAKELQRDLLALWRKYDTRQPEQNAATRHLLRLQLAPLGHVEE